MEAYPLQWPQGKARVNKAERSRFSVSFTVARDSLFNELRRMGVELPVLSTNITLRRDGLPYANQPEPDDTGICVYFMWKDHQMAFSCDRWDRVKDNIQAVKLTIAALRGLDRWGTGDMIEAAFRGFEALPPPSSEDWYAVLGVATHSTAQEIKSAFKEKYQRAVNDDERIKLNAAYQKSKERDNE